MNPFRDAIVASPWEAAPSDVPAIHRQVFDRCLAGIDEVRTQRRSRGLLIHGEAGSGKTHLLGRLRGQLAPREPSATDRPECLFVWVRLQTSPRMIWRTLRRTLVDDWFRPVAGGHTQFQRILFHRLAEVRPAEGDLERWYEYMLDEDPAGLLQAMEEIAVKLDLDRNTDIAFKHIALGRHMRDLRAWLDGTSLPEAALARIDLEQTDGTNADREDEARRVVLMLCRLAGSGLPVVLSFDQVEALQTVPGDRDALFAFGQMISTLHDGAGNLLLVSCVQSAMAVELKDHARLADYDRITSLGAVSLDPISRNEARQLIDKRLAGAPQPEDERRNPCWPLAPDEFESLFASGFVSPRKLLARCAERYSSQGDRSDVVPVEPERSRPVRDVPGFLKVAWDARLARKLVQSSQFSTEEVFQQGWPLLVHLLAPQCRQVHDETLKDVEPLFETPGGRCGFSLCTQPHMTSLAARLKRLLKQYPSERLPRLVLIRDSRIPISNAAKAARERLAELEQQGARVLYPSLEVLAALDTLRDLLSDAKSGDLAWQGETIAARTVEEWLLVHLPHEARRFVDVALEIGTASPAVEACDTPA